MNWLQYISMGMNTLSATFRLGSWNIRLNFPILYPINCSDKVFFLFCSNICEQSVRQCLSNVFSAISVSLFPFSDCESMGIGLFDIYLLYS